MASSPPIVAHVIVGAKRETYLACALEGIADVCDHAVINDTSGQGPGPNASAIGDSRFAREGRLTLLQTAFADFASARNACIDGTPPRLSRGWGMVVDADEVHGIDLASAAALLPRLPEDIDAVDGYLRHFVGSFAWWTEINRTRCFFRLGATRRWQGKIHERVTPLGHRIALPMIWFHYGHVVTPREEAEKGRFYASLGQPDPAPSDAQVRNASAASVWPALLRRASPFRGEHPRAARATIAALSSQRAALFAEVDALAARQTPVERLRNTARALNAQRLLLWRSAEVRLRWAWRSEAPATALNTMAADL